MKNRKRQDHPCMQNPIKPPTRLVITIYRIQLKYDDVDDDDDDDDDGGGGGDDDDDDNDDDDDVRQLRRR